MKQVLLAIALVAIAGTAFAEAGRPIRQGGKCWAITDARGFGYWDHCAAGHELVARNRERGFDPNTPRARTQLDLFDYDGAGGGGASAGGGGGNGR
jgi:hypothetical protein